MESTITSDKTPERLLHNFSVWDQSQVPQAIMFLLMAEIAKTHDVGLTIIHRVKIFMMDVRIQVRAAFTRLFTIKFQSSSSTCLWFHGLRFPISVSCTSLGYVRFFTSGSVFIDKNCSARLTPSRAFPNLFSACTSRVTRTFFNHTFIPCSKVYRTASKTIKLARCMCLEFITTFSARFRLAINHDYILTNNLGAINI